MTELSLLIPRSELKLDERLADLRNMDFFIYEGEVPDELDFEGNIILINSIKKIGEYWEIAYGPGGFEHFFERGGREKVVGTVNPPRGSHLYETIEKSAKSLGIPIIEDSGIGLIRKLYGEVHLIDTRKEKPEEWGVYGLDSRAIVIVFPAKGYLEQEVVQAKLREKYCISCNGNSEEKKDSSLDDSID